MKTNLKLLILLLSSNCFAQLKLEAVVVDSIGREPIEFVGVYNNKNHTMTNEDGRFSFSSVLDTIVFSCPGYEKLKTTFAQIKDTVYLQKSILELDEVIVTNSKSALQKVLDSTRKNYAFEPYKERFLIRALAKKDGKIWRIQDIKGKLARKRLFLSKNTEKTKNDYVVEVTHMRKQGLVNDENNAYLIFPSFTQIFNATIDVHIDESKFDIKELTFENGKKIRLEFKSFPEEKIKNISGYYIIDAASYAIEAYYIKSIPKNAPFKANKWLRYRDTFLEKHIIFQKHPETNQYYISSAKVNNRVETTNEEKSFNLVYDLNTIITTSNNFGGFNVKKNVHAKRDLFKIKFPYEAAYWNSQNDLLLTDEMLEFIEKSESNTEFKVKSNLE